MTYSTVEHLGSWGCGQGWWWEADEDLTAPASEAEAWRFTWAVAATNVLRNLAFLKVNEACLAGGACLAVLVHCLDVRQRWPTPDTNELARNALDILHQVGCPCLPAFRGRTYKHDGHRAHLWVAVLPARHRALDMGASLQHC